MNIETLARPYAEAIFRLAVEREQLKKWSAFLNTVYVVITHEEVKEFMQNPRFSPEERCEWLMDITKSTLFLEAKNFLNLLNEHRRFALVPAILQLFNQYRVNYENSVRVTINSAIPLDKKEKNALEERLMARFKARIEPTYSVLPDLLGGLVIRIEDKNLVIDSSVQTKLERLHSVLTN